MTTNAQTPNRRRVILFLGAPGSGKGTQSSRLSSRLRLSCLSTGEILRSEAKRNTSAGLRLRRVLASGSLVSDEMVCSVVETRLRREVPDAGLILDGFPRTVKQATFLDGLLSRLGISRPTVVHLHVSYQGLLRRLTARRHCAACGAVYNLISRPSLRGSRCECDGGPLVEREDDAEEVIRRRLAEFDHLSAPLIEYYRGSDYHPMDGDRDPDIIARDLLEIVQGRQLCASVA